MNLAEIINNYTANEELRAVLNEYYTKNPYKYMHHSLRLLGRLTSDETEQIAIVKQSLDNGWRAFYKVANL
jgi:hypothetical protein|nr:MAG TPA: hypothetical protein [Caudoviricetes sp.]